MKRINNLYPRIYAEENIAIADNKARKCKRTRYGVRKHDENKELDNFLLHMSLRDEDYHTSEYTTYKDQLRNWILAIKVYLTNVLNLKLKDNYQIYPVESRGVDFVGYVCYHDYTLLRKSIKLKLLELVRAYKDKKIGKSKLQLKLASYFGWLKYCDSKNLLREIYQKTNIWYSGWNGVRTNISKFKGRWIYVVNVEPRNKYFLVQFIYNEKPYEFKSANRQLFQYLNTFQNYQYQLKLNHVYTN